MQEALEKAVKAAAEKAISAQKGDEALKFTQAALNAMHALITLTGIEKNKKELAVAK